MQAVIENMCGRGIGGEESEPGSIQTELQEEHITVLIIFKELPFVSRSQTPHYNPVHRGTLSVSAHQTQTQCTSMI